MNNKSRTESTVGEIVNLMSVDCQHIADVSTYLWAMWSSPLQIIGALIFLYYTVSMCLVLWMESTVKSIGNRLIVALTLTLLHSERPKLEFWPL